MNISNHGQFPIVGPPGQNPEVLKGTDTPDTTTFFTAPAEGSLYVRSDTDTPATPPNIWQKLDDEGRADDWGGYQAIAQRVLYSEFTDGGAAVGTLVLDQQIPQGATVLRAQVINVTGFAGDTSAALTIGDGTDADRYNTGTINVFSTANAVVTGAPSGQQEHASAASVTLTITTAANFTAVNAGALTIRIWYVV